MATSIRFGIKIGIVQNVTCEFRFCELAKMVLDEPMNKHLKTFSVFKSRIGVIGSEIKRLKHYLHPDKHGGKTKDLFIRVSQLGEK